MLNSMYLEANSARCRCGGRAAMRLLNQFMYSLARCVVSWRNSITTSSCPIEKEESAGIPLALEISFTSPVESNKGRSKLIFTAEAFSLPDLSTAAKKAVATTGSSPLLICFLISAIRSGVAYIGLATSIQPLTVRGKRVASSDLLLDSRFHPSLAAEGAFHWPILAAPAILNRNLEPNAEILHSLSSCPPLARSEERRVGKE